MPVRVDTEEAEKFIDLIAPYISRDPHAMEELKEKAWDMSKRMHDDEGTSETTFLIGYLAYKIWCNTEIACGTGITFQEAATRRL